MSTHYYQDIQSLCDKIWLMNDGRIVLDYEVGEINKV